MIRRVASGIVTAFLFVFEVALSIVFPESYWLGFTRSTKDGDK